MNFNQLKGVVTGVARTSAFPENKELVRRIGADSMVLLKNDGTLPLKRSNVALFGAGAIDTIFCASGTSYVFGEERVNVIEGLRAGGFTFSSESWLKKMDKEVRRSKKKSSDIDLVSRVFSGEKKFAEELPITDADLAESRIGTDTCIYVIRRATNAWEPRKYEKGDYLLSEVEEKNIERLSISFEKIIVVLNTSIIDLSTIIKNKKIKSILYMGVPGMEAGNSLYDVITGVVSPSGHLTDTWAKKYKDNPACSSYLKKKAQIECDYNEGLYVGYRYFDTYGIAPLFPFGFGLSYTKFEMEDVYFEANWFNIILRVKVTNVGEYAGREVVQVYVSAPSGKLDKPNQELKGFAKTGKLRPGESEEVTIRIKTDSLSSFSEKRSAYVMERGTYLFRVGENSRDTKVMASLVLDKLTVIKNLASVVVCEKEMEFMSPPELLKEQVGFVRTATLESDNYDSLGGKVKLRKQVTSYIPEGKLYTSYINSNPYKMPEKCKELVEYVKPGSHATFVDVVKGRISVEEFVASLPAEVLARIVVGSMDESVHASNRRLKHDIKCKPKYKMSGKTTNQYASSLGIPGTVMADGPSGLHIAGVSCTCYPSPLSMAQTWDVSAMAEVGRAYGREMEYHKIDFALAPCLNVHRDPLAGRDIEFYSEDPVVSGLMAAAFTKGVQTYDGRLVVLKHMGIYHRIDERNVASINISRRALREIYLKSFEICVANSEPLAIMDSCNAINGRDISSRRGINTDIIRTEWGFKGFVMSEWGTDSDKVYDIHAGCDLIMPGYEPEVLLQAMGDARPEFDADGFVKQIRTCEYFKKDMIKYDAWGSFLPDKDGKEVAMTEVQANVELNPKVLEYEKAGLCTVSYEESGIKVIRYHGINRGACLTIGDLQAAVIHILAAIAETGAMKNLIRQVERH